MSFSPVIPTTGLAGWRFLQATLDRQRAAFADGTMVQRETEHFRQNIGAVSTPDELVADRTLLKVALGAYGLDDEIAKKFFLKKVLSEGTDLPNALANKLVDPRYREITGDFGFGRLTPPDLSAPDFADHVISRYHQLQFERAVGEADNSMRLAMTFEREIEALSDPDLASSTGWFRVMGSPPLRKFFETAMGLPAETGVLDIDRQLRIFTSRAKAVFGFDTLSGFGERGEIDKALRLFFARDEASQSAGAAVPGYAALSILQPIRPLVSLSVRS
jgi:hypothetical protein